MDEIYINEFYRVYFVEYHFPHYVTENRKFPDLDPLACQQKFNFTMS